MECERTDPANPLRQGDIIAAQPGSDAWRNPWSRFGVVLTADCDLAQGKSGPNLVYVPVIGHYTYIADIWLPAEAEKLARVCRQKIDRQLATFQSTIIFRHVDAWGMEGGDKNIVQKLSEQLGGRKSGTESTAAFEQIIRLWQAGRELEALSNTPLTTQSGHLRALLGRLVEYGSIVAPQVLGDPKSCRNHLEGALCSLQERLDTWLVRELIGLDGDMVESPPIFGYIVPLRSFSLLPVGLIDTDRNQWYRNRDHYLRICRLRGVYKSDLIQKFSNLFVRVGLEDYRVEEHRRAFTRCAQSLFPVEDA